MLPSPLALTGTADQSHPELHRVVPSAQVPAESDDVALPFLLTTSPMTQSQIVNVEIKVGRREQHAQDFPYLQKLLAKTQPVGRISILEIFRIVKAMVSGVAGG